MNRHARMPTRGALAALATVIPLLIPQAHAFDGDRRGFALGAYGGVHTSDIEADVDGGGATDGSESGIALRLTIGGGISERVVLFGTLDQQFDSDAAYGLLGPGAAFYFRGNGPSAYLFGAAGLGVLTIDDEVETGFNAGDDYETADGGGLVFGGGYAFTQGFHLDGSVMALAIEDDENFAVDVDYDIVSLRVMAGYVWY